MSIFENNMSVLQEFHPDIYQKIDMFHPDTNQIFIGDAVNGETFLVFMEQNIPHPLNSIYDPSYAAERFAIQFRQLASSTVLMIAGLNDGRIVRKVLAKDCPVKKCIVCEPSMEVFVKSIHEYDLCDILGSDSVSLIIQGINDSHAEQLIVECVDYMEWKSFSMIALPYYTTIFPDEVQQYYQWYSHVLSLKRAEQESLVYFAEVGCRNEIHALKWLLRSKSVLDLKNKIPKEIPCIVVAAGPSLEKNVSYLKKAKGKACIIAVDSACEFLLKNDVIPDCTCTIDAQKGPEYYTSDDWKGIPVFLSTESGCDLLEHLHDFIPIYIRLNYNYYNLLLNQKGKSISNFDGGGSVGTMIFRLALELGFHTVIIVGQDLAYTDGLSHAGTGRVSAEELTRYDSHTVAGYYGEPVYTSGDFKLYIDWYQRIIPLFQEDHIIINATEGGARLEGAIQMSLQEAVDTYCHQDYDFRQFIDDLPYIWDTPEEIRRYYQEISRDYHDMQLVQARIPDACTMIDRVVQAICVENDSTREIRNLECDINACVSDLQRLRTYDMIYARSIKQNIEMQDQLMEKSDRSPGQEQIHLYQVLEQNLKGALAALEEIIPIWEKVLQDIKNMGENDYVDI